MQPHIVFNPSSQFIMLISSILIATLIIIIFLPCSIWLKLILIMIVFPYGLFILNRYGLLQDAHSIIGITPVAEGWQLHTKDKIYLAELLGDSVITRYASVLRFKIRPRSYNSVIVFKDSFVAKQGYRRFCLQLRITPKERKKHLLSLSSRAKGTP